ncbi:50S ribosomal protein L32 [Levilactobacillus brevis]|uniref:50S ribosomal protein L32 n=1 Tax=Levilactobacillus brevis TaxID=1580 RepID=UPI001BAB21A8|nr:50S ribosomal protein L32 [Levilactobacillus brevis]MBS0979099.1 50S ribosomal protein L32 [Levilactobacillus brevis]
MATPARRQSRSRKLRRRATQKLTSPEIHWDNQLQEYVLSHHVSLKGYYHGRQVLHKSAK